jgi:hypothetical protein
MNDERGTGEKEHYITEHKRAILTYW